MMKSYKKLPPIKKQSQFEVIECNGSFYILDEIVKNKKYVFDWIKLPDNCKYYPEKKRGSPSFGAQGCSKLIMKGNDGKLYISKADKRGVYTWKRFKTMDQAKTAEDYYFQWGVIEEKFNKKAFIKKFESAKKELEKKGIYFMYIGWKCCLFFIDNAWEEAEDIVMKKARVDDPMKRSYMFFTDYKLYNAVYESGVVRIQNNVLRKDKDVIGSIFKKYFGNKFKIGSRYDEIEIKLERF
jgi:hypothetical protein